MLIYIPNPAYYKTFLNGSTVVLAKKTVMKESVV